MHVCGLAKNRQWKYYFENSSRNGCLTGSYTLNKQQKQQHAKKSSNENFFRLEMTLQDWYHFCYPVMPTVTLTFLTSF